MLLKKCLIGSLGAVTMLQGACTAVSDFEVDRRAPSVPLVAVDPYFSIWSPADRLTDADTDHWTEAPNRLTSLVQIDGKPYRIMGKDPAGVPALEQVDIDVLPTTVTYTFEGAGVRVELAFFTPLLPDDLMVFARPVTYLTWTAESIDGKAHEVRVHYDNTAELVVDNPDTQSVEWSTESVGSTDVLKIGSYDQPVLRRSGDQYRIDWGYLYVAVPGDQDANLAIASADYVRPLWGKDAKSVPSTRTLAKDAPVLSVEFDMGKVKGPESRYLVLAYDDIHSALYFEEKLDPYWKKDGDTAQDLIRKSVSEYKSLQKKASAFDQELMSDLVSEGGLDYAWLSALSYRQSIAASKLMVDSAGMPLWFCKENSSNGCMGTVDVFYPQAPLPLFLSPTLTKAMLVPILDYSASDLWKWPNAPHDVGTWPHANGQVYGGSESNGGMPVEESGNMLLLVAAVAEIEGNADFASKYWPTLTGWMEYLERYGKDPENQLCTDDFAGHLAHNANLAAKAICAIGAYAKLAEMRGEGDVAEKYFSMAREYAQYWMEAADDGDHYRLAYDREGSWSSKYNLVWDHLLGLNIFPDEVYEKEMSFYLGQIEKYGLPLDGRLQNAPGRRARWSKTDWAFWTACLTDDDADFKAITDPVYNYYDETNHRVGLTDLYFVDEDNGSIFKARPVMGGIFIKMLYNKKLWNKWASRDKTELKSDWAPLPVPPEVIEVVKPASLTWKYTFSKPANGWQNTSFDDSGWKSGKGGFGTGGTPSARVGTEWNTRDIWLRSELTIPEGDYEDLKLYLHHDEDVQIYMNGELVCEIPGYTSRYQAEPTNESVKLKPGTYSVAIHCTQTIGGQYIDLGIVDVRPGKPRD